MTLHFNRPVIIGSALALAGVLGIGGVAMAQASNDERPLGSTPTTTQSPVSAPTPSPSSSDDPATHDLNDDNGVDDPATHDVGDDNGVDDPATHDVGDDNGGDHGDNSGPGSATDDSNSHSGTGDDHGSDD
jgi:hypothetical protein